jgi:hypothetical protein
MHADHARDDEFEAREPHALVGQALEFEGKLGLPTFMVIFTGALGMPFSERSITSASRMPR